MHLQVEEADDGRQALSSSIDEWARRGSYCLRKQRVISAIPQLIEEGMPFFVVSASGVLLFRVVMLMALSSPMPSQPMTTALVMLVPIVLFLTCRQIGEFMRDVPRVEALAVADEKLGLGDRLRTADEFMALEARSGNHEAELDETARRLATVTVRDFDVVAPAGDMGSMSWLWAVAGAVIFGVAMLISPSSSPTGGAVHQWGAAPVPHQWTSPMQEAGHPPVAVPEDG